MSCKDFSYAHVCLVFGSEEIPSELLQDMKERLFYRYSSSKNYHEFNIEGQNAADDILSELKPFNSYLADGFFSVQTDIGDEYQGTFDKESKKWFVEWRECYYPSELPSKELFSTVRAAGIINTMVDELMEGADSSYAREVLFNMCGLTDKEIEVLGLDWLKDLRV